MKSKISKGLILVMFVTMCFGNVGFSAASEPYLVGLDPTEKIMAASIYNAYVNSAKELNAQVAALTEPRIEGVSKQAVTIIDGYKERFDVITYQTPILSSLLAQASMLDMIPVESQKDMVDMMKPEVERRVHEMFITTEADIDVAIKDLLGEITPVIITKLKPEIKNIIYDAGELIDQELNKTIKAEIIKILPDLKKSLPKDISLLTEDQIADKYLEKMMPAGEASVSRSMENEIKLIVMGQVETLVETRINAYMQPKMDVINEESYLAILNALPDNIIDLFGEDYIRGLVDNEINGLKDRMPSKMDTHETTMKTAIKTEIGKFIDDTTKIYVDGKLSTVKGKIQNSNMYVDVSQMSKVFGATSKYVPITKSVTIKKGNKTVVFKLNSRDITINGKVQKAALEVGEKPFLNGKAPYVPLEDMSEVFGYDYNDNPDFGLSSITK